MSLYVAVVAAFVGLLLVGAAVVDIVSAPKASILWKPYRSYFYGDYELHLDEFKDGSWLVTDTEGVNKRFHNFNQAMAYFTETLNIVRHRTKFTIAA